MPNRPPRFGGVIRKDMPAPMQGYGQMGQYGQKLPRGDDFGAGYGHFADIHPEILRQMRTGGIVPPGQFGGPMQTGGPLPPMPMPNYQTGGGMPPMQLPQMQTGGGLPPSYMGNPYQTTGGPGPQHFAGNFGPRPSSSYRRPQGTANYLTGNFGRTFEQ